MSKSIVRCGATVSRTRASLIFRLDSGLETIRKPTVPIAATMVPLRVICLRMYLTGFEKVEQ